MQQAQQQQEPYGGYAHTTREADVQQRQQGNLEWLQMAEIQAPPLANVGKVCPVQQLQREDETTPAVWRQERSSDGRDEETAPRKLETAEVAVAKNAAYCGDLISERMPNTLDRPILSRTPREPTRSTQHPWFVAARPGAAGAAGVAAACYRSIPSGRESHGYRRDS